MNASRRLAELAATVLLAAAAAGQDLAVDEVSALFARGRYDLAWTETQHIESAEQRAAWRFHVQYNAGNLPAALDAALEGLEAAPHSLELLHNATLCAVTLGLGELADGLQARWKAAIESRALEPQARTAWLETHARYAAQIEQVMARDAAAESAARRARWVCAIGLGAAAVGLLGLSLARDRGTRALRGSAAD